MPDLTLWSVGDDGPMSSDVEAVKRDALAAASFVKEWEFEFADSSVVFDFRPRCGEDPGGVLCDALLGDCDEIVDVDGRTLRCAGGVCSEHGLVGDRHLCES